MEDRYKEREEGGKSEDHVAVIIICGYRLLCLPVPARYGNPKAGSDCDEALCIRKRFDKEISNPLPAFILCSLCRLLYLFRAPFSVLGETCYAKFGIVWTVMYMQSNRTHRVFQRVSLFSTYVSSTCFGPHRSIIRSVLYKLYSQTLVCAVI